MFYDVATKAVINVLHLQLEVSFIANTKFLKKKSVSLFQNVI